MADFRKAARALLDSLDPERLAHGAGIGDTRFKFEPTRNPGYYLVWLMKKPGSTNRIGAEKAALGTVIRLASGWKVDEPGTGTFPDRNQAAEALFKWPTRRPTVKLLGYTVEAQEPDPAKLVGKFELPLSQDRKLVLEPWVKSPYADHYQRFVHVVSQRGTYKEPLGSIWLVDGKYYSRTPLLNGNETDRGPFDSQAEAVMELWNQVPSWKREEMKITHAEYQSRYGKRRF